jgi:plastocyanin
MNKMLSIAIALVACSALVACGGKTPSTSIDVIMTDFQFQPNEFLVPAGQEITLNVVNNGAVVHNFVIMNLGTSAGAAYDDDDDANVYWQEKDIQTGGDFSVTFIAPIEPGEYEVVCRTEGHIASGMVGKLIVVPDDQ